MFDKIKEFFNKLKLWSKSIYRNLKFFIKDSKKKFNNLYQTNYNNGMYHLEHGNLWDATFRFKIIMKFWPDKVDPKYQYAVCLVVIGDEDKATKILNEILKKNPNYSKAKDLLAKIKNGEAKKIATDFKNNSKEDKSISTKIEHNAKSKSESGGDGNKKRK